MKSLSRRGIMRLFGASAAGAAVATRLPPEAVREGIVPMQGVSAAQNSVRGDSWYGKANAAFQIDPEKMRLDRAIEEAHRVSRMSGYAREVMLPEIDCMRSWSPAYRALRQAEILMARVDRQDELERKHGSLWDRFATWFERGCTGAPDGERP